MTDTYQIPPDADQTPDGFKKACDWLTEQDVAWRLVAYKWRLADWPAIDHVEFVPVPGGQWVSAWPGDTLGADDYGQVAVKARWPH